MIPPADIAGGFRHVVWGGLTQTLFQLLALGGGRRPALRPAPRMPRCIRSPSDEDRELLDLLRAVAAGSYRRR